MTKLEELRSTGCHGECIDSIGDTLLQWVYYVLHISTNWHKIRQDRDRNSANSDRDSEIEARYVGIGTVIEV